MGVGESFAATFNAIQGVKNRRASLAESEADRASRERIADLALKAREAGNAASRSFQSGESAKDRELSVKAAELSRAFTHQENETDQAFKERITKFAQDFQAGQSALDRVGQKEALGSTQTFQASEGQKNRAVQEQTNTRIENRQTLEFMQHETERLGALQGQQVQLSLQLSNYNQDKSKAFIDLQTAIRHKDINPPEILQEAESNYRQKVDQVIALEHGLGNISGQVELAAQSLSMTSNVARNRAMMGDVAASGPASNSETMDTESTDVTHTTSAGASVPAPSTQPAEPAAPTPAPTSATESPVNQEGARLAFVQSTPWGKNAKIENGQIMIHAANASQAVQIEKQKQREELKVDPTGGSSLGIVVDDQAVKAAAQDARANELQIKGAEQKQDAQGQNSASKAVMPALKGIGIHPVATEDGVHFLGQDENKPPVFTSLDPVSGKAAVPPPQMVADTLFALAEQSRAEPGLAKNAVADLTNTITDYLGKLDAAGELKFMDGTGKAGNPPRYVANLFGSSIESTMKLGTAIDNLATRAGANPRDLFPKIVPPPPHRAVDQFLSTLGGAYAKSDKQTVERHENDAKKLVAYLGAYRLDSTGKLSEDDSRRVAAAFANDSNDTNLHTDIKLALKGMIATKYEGELRLAFGGSFSQGR